MELQPSPVRRRVPAAERREELIAAAVHEFARGGLHGTPVERIARRVGVAQPYVFTLFGTKRELFLAAWSAASSGSPAPSSAPPPSTARGARPPTAPTCWRRWGSAYKELLAADRDYLMLQHQSYAACDDEVVRARVRRCYAALVGLAQALSGAEDERIDDFFRHGMVLNVAAALGVEDLSSDCAWIQVRVGVRVLAGRSQCSTTFSAMIASPIAAPTPASSASSRGVALARIPASSSKAIRLPTVVHSAASTPVASAIPNAQQISNASNGRHGAHQDRRFVSVSARPGPRDVDACALRGGVRDVRVCVREPVQQDRDHRRSGRVDVVLVTPALRGQHGADREYPVDQPRRVALR